MNAAETAPIGRTGLRVSRLGFGGTGLGRMFWSTEAADAQDAVDAEWAAGLQFPLLHPAVASVEVGMRSRVEVERNAALLGAAVAPALWMELERQPP